MTAWPKTPPSLDAAQLAIAEDWQSYWLTQGMGKYSAVMKFGHDYVLRQGRGLEGPLLEIGPGRGDHIALEVDAGQDLSQVHAFELREEMVTLLRQRFPAAQIRQGDCMAELPKMPGRFSRIVAMHVFEHLSDLPAALDAIAGALQPGRGRLLMVIPCEGGLGYALGRRVTTQRQFEQRYHVPYRPFIEYEHLSTAAEVLRELRFRFEPEHTTWWPTGLPSVHLNLCVGMRLRAR